MNHTYRFCPRCAAPLAQGEKFGRTRKHCRYCGFIHFVEPKVAVAAVVSDGKRVLLVRRAASPRVGYWALPAGYMDADELPEEALAREVAEETGVAVRVRRLQGIAPLAGWAERRGILLLYRAEPVAGEVEPGDDVSEARWFRGEEIPWDELAFESTAEFVRDWVNDAPDGPSASDRPSSR
jgi:ADP-ribose pyrophosphatase YjhB (NUDIX family)